MAFIALVVGGKTAGHSNGVEHDGSARW